MLGTKETAMKSYAVSSVSKLANGKRAQVTIPTGKGLNQRSVTRHIGLVGDRWIGFNPDERAIPLNERYEDELTVAKSKLASAEAALKDLRKKLGEVETDTPETIIDAAMLKEMRAELDEAIKIAQNNVYAASADVDNAKEKLNIVRDELPLEVEFFGPGLTY